MEIPEQVAYWKNLADSDLEVARRFLQRGEDLHYCLFFCHMSLEKLIKGLVVAATKETPPKIHDLLKLANKAKLELNAERAAQLKDFNAFNLEARYPDYKLSFYKLCTLDFAKEQFAQIEEVYQWLNNLYTTPSSMMSAS